MVSKIFSLSLEKLGIVIAVENDKIKRNFLIVRRIVKNS